MLPRPTTPSRSGFTIVELLIVIVVIGILAAITIVAYNGIQNRARIAGLQSELTQNAQLLQNYAVQNSDQLPGDQASAVALGLKAASGETLTYTYNGATNPVSYCLQIASGTTTYTVSTTSTTPAAGTCTVTSAITTAAGSAPLAVLTGASGSTGIADGALASGFSVYALTNVTLGSAFYSNFTLGTGASQESFSIDSTANSSRNGANYLSTFSLVGVVPQGVSGVMGGSSIVAFIQSGTNRYVRTPGMQQVSNTDGYSVTTSPTYSTVANSSWVPFGRVWIFAGVHSQATSEAVMSAIASDATVGANGKPVNLGISAGGAYGSVSIDLYTYSLPLVLTSGSAYGSPTPTIQWQVSNNNSTWNDISGATTTTYTVTNANLYNPGADSYYRTKQTNAKGTTYSYLLDLYYGGGG